MRKGPIPGFGAGNWLVPAAIAGSLAVAVLQLTQLQRKRLRTAAGEQARGDIRLIPFTPGRPGEAPGFSSAR